MTDKPHRLSLKLDPGTNWIEINWWKVKLWQFWKTLPTVEWVQTRKFNWRIPAPCMPWKSTTFLLHCTRGHRLGKVLVEFQDQANDSIFDTCKVTHCEIWDQLIAFPLWPLPFQICSSARVWRTTCKVVMAHSKDTKETRQVWLARYILTSVVRYILSSHSGERGRHTWL